MNQDIDREIQALLDFPDRPPSPALAEYACEQDWIGIRHRNWCINLDGAEIKDERRREFLREVCYYIFRGYLSSKK